MLVILILICKGCTHGDIRLQEGSTPLEGRVEICLNNVWSTVCRNSWDSTDARVVCRQLGFSTAGINSAMLGPPASHCTLLFRQHRHYIWVRLWLHRTELRPMQWK